MPDMRDNFAGKASGTNIPVAMPTPQPLTRERCAFGGGITASTDGVDVAYYVLDYTLAHAHPRCILTSLKGSAVDAMHAQYVYVLTRFMPDCPCSLLSSTFHLQLLNHCCVRLL